MSLPTPYGGQNRVKLKSREYLIWTSIALGLVLIIFLFAFELPHFNNTFRLGKMFLGSSIVAILTGTFIIFKIKNTFKDSIDAIRVSLMVCLGLVAVFFVLTHFLNRNIIRGETRIESYPFLEQELYKIDPGSEEIHEQLFIIYLQNDNNMKRIISRGPIYKDEMSGRNVDIQVANGLLGFKVAQTLNK